MLHAMIMAGGGGTRFWPRSRRKFPKQFLTLAGDRTLLQQAFDRIEALAGADHVWVITSATHQDLCGEQLAAVARNHIIGEPMGRATAEKYIATGEYFWNSGIFVWRVQALLDEFKKNQPELLASMQRIASAWGTPAQDEVFRKEFEPLKKISIDFAIMEKAKEVIVL